MTDEERFFFCHFPRTGGSSLTVSLLRQFGQDAIYPRPADIDGLDVAMAGTDIDHLASVFDQNRDTIRVIGGHFPLCAADRLGVPFRTFTILRDPIERSLSHLRYLRRVDPRYRDLSLHEIYAIPQVLFSYLHNHMVKTLAMTGDEAVHGILGMVGTTEDHLQRAKDALDAMDVVGIQDRFHDFHDDLERAFGWDLGPVEHVNATDDEEATPQLRTHLEMANLLDVELYEYAQKLVSERGGVRPGTRG